MYGDHFYCTGLPGQFTCLAGGEVSGPGRTVLVRIQEYRLDVKQIHTLAQCHDVFSVAVRIGRIDHVGNFLSWRDTDYLLSQFAHKMLLCVLTLQVLPVNIDGRIVRFAQTNRLF